MLWFDGALIAGTRAPFDLTDRGLTLGDGAFDTALALDGRIVFAEAHVARLVAAAASLGFAVDPIQIAEAMRAVASAFPQAAIRTTVTRGSGPRGLAPPAEPRPMLWASAAPVAPGFAFAPLRLHPTAIRRNETSPTSRLKTLGYLDAVLAAGEARAAGFDEALFLNTRDAVACAGTGNLFALFGTRLATPPLHDGVLAGIVRGEILGSATAFGFKPEERSLTLPELLRADAVFLTNSLRGIAPVTAIGMTVFTDHPAMAVLIAALRAAMAA
ncbi:class IV aminotransferase [Methylobacterium sp. BTF04]|uniref:aminotransferase class IV n=1 Tax=Methylobacterium sp. BTF04 TaxID=2708300 RepID=UPI0013D24725|nr:aminotransferase class IV [Methylobacterium sp. BTF04]NEU11259.1 class IV aminotransferase [Methylobacterium sp. BTF04]